MSEDNDLSDKNMKILIEQHAPQLLKSGVPEYMWESALRKIYFQLYDAGEYFSFCEVRYINDDMTISNKKSWEVLVSKPDGIKSCNPNSIFIIDHAWTFIFEEAEQQLKTIPGLLSRMASLMSIAQEDLNENDIIADVKQNIWKYCCTYSFDCIDMSEHKSVWYIMDEFGARIRISSVPNIKIIPFYYIPHKCCYSLLFPLKDLEHNEEIKRFVCDNISDLNCLRSKMVVWTLEDLTYIDCSHEDHTDFYYEALCTETQPSLNFSLEPLKDLVTVYTEYSYVKHYLSDERFRVVDSVSQADVIWLISAFTDFNDLSKCLKKRINQCQCEYLITNKDILPFICRRYKSMDNSARTLLPETYCLKTELPKFVSYYQRKSKLGSDNVWIVKPSNLSRGLETVITDDLSHIIRLAETGPKIAQEYISDPVLYYRDDICDRVKFDLRYIVMLLSVNPLKMTCNTFSKNFNEQHPNYDWENIQLEINKLIKQVFIAATYRSSPYGIPHNPQTKGFYGLDIMLKWENTKHGKEIVPELLEVNFSSDCKRACEYYPHFFNDVFAVMFLDVTKDHNVEIL